MSHTYTNTHRKKTVGHIIYLEQYVCTHVCVASAVWAH